MPPPMWRRGAVYNTPVQTNASAYPIIGMTGLLNLVAVVEKFQTQTIEEKGTLCPPTPCPRRIVNASCGCSASCWSIN